MKVQEFEIKFDDASQNPHTVYRSGQFVQFQVHLKLLKPVKCRAIYVALFGHSTVHWTERGKSRNAITHIYNSEEIYIDQKTTIFTPPSQGPLAEHHPAGEYFYPVSFQIPGDAPSSFESEVGKIRYYIKANIDRPWRFDTFTQRMYTVIRDLDLNAKPTDATGPFERSDEFDVDCCYCFNCCYGRVRVHLVLPKRGFVPGEQVRVRGELRNTSATDLQSLSLEIYQRLLYHTKTKTKTTTRVASSVELPGVPEGDTLHIDHSLPVLPLPSSYIEGCSNIEIQYFFRLNADGGICLSVTQECCELLIGTIPLSPAGGLPGSYDMQVPPSYEECMFGRQDVDFPPGGNTNAREFGNVQRQWAPSYPVYALLPPVSSAWL